MPDDFAHLMAVSGTEAFDRGGDVAMAVAAHSTVLVRQLLSRNGELAKLNRQLSVVVERLKSRPETALANLTPRQRQIMALVLEGQPSKNIAADLNLSQRTVENHRAAIMRRTGATSLPALARLALGVSGVGDSRLRPDGLPAGSRALP